MLHAYRLVYDFSEYGTPQLWEWEQPYIEALVLHARTFNRRVVGWWFEDWDALDQDNTRIWNSYYRPKPAYDHIADWRAYLEQHREIIVEVQEIAEETWWRGKDEAVGLQWKGLWGYMV